MLTLPLPELGVCQFAAVLLVAVSTCPVVGAVALLTTTVVVAELMPFAAVAVPAVRLAAVPVRFVAVPLEGVPSAPPFTTNAPADPTLSPSAVATPVPSADNPVPPCVAGRGDVIP